MDTESKRNSLASSLNRTQSLKDIMNEKETFNRDEKTFEQELKEFPRNIQNDSRGGENISSEINDNPPFDISQEKQEDSFKKNLKEQQNNKSINSDIANNSNNNIIISNANNNNNINSSSTFGFDPPKINFLLTIKFKVLGSLIVFFTGSVLVFSLVLFLIFGLSFAQVNQNEALQQSFRTLQAERNSEVNMFSWMMPTAAWGFVTKNETKKNSSDYQIKKRPNKKMMIKKHRNLKPNPKKNNPQKKNK